jgi:hypothetical protein
LDFRGLYFFRRIRSLCLLEIDKAETKIACGDHVC